MKINTRRQEELEGAAGWWLAGLAPGMMSPWNDDWPLE